jgi:predicted lipoprotein with Yx(FWY)xxD motif
MRLPLVLLTAIVAIAAAISGCRDGTPTSAPPRLAVRDSPALGRFITDETGRPLYVLSADSKTTSACYDACAAIWHPVPGTATAADIQEPAIQPELVGVFTRRDGVLQRTYAGRPLYFRDVTTHGEPETAITDRWGTWSLLFPHGEPMSP